MFSSKNLQLIKHLLAITIVLITWLTIIFYDSLTGSTIKEANILMSIVAILSGYYLAILATEELYWNYNFTKHSIRGQIIVSTAAAHYIIFLVINYISINTIPLTILFLILSAAFTAKIISGKHQEHYYQNRINDEINETSELIKVIHSKNLANEISTQKFQQAILLLQTNTNKSAIQRFAEICYINNAAKDAIAAKGSSIPIFSNKLAILNKAVEVELKNHQPQPPHI